MPGLQAAVYMWMHALCLPMPLGCNTPQDLMQPSVTNQHASEQTQQTVQMIVTVDVWPVRFIVLPYTAVSAVHLVTAHSFAYKLTCMSVVPLLPVPKTCWLSGAHWPKGGPAGDPLPLDIPLSLPCSCSSCMNCGPAV